MLELYHNIMSVCARKVRLVLAEKGVEAYDEDSYLSLMAAQGEAQWAAVAAALEAT